MEGLSGFGVFQDCFIAAGYLLITVSARSAIVIVAIFPPAVSVAVLRAFGVIGEEEYIRAFPGWADSPLGATAVLFVDLLTPTALVNLYVQHKNTLGVFGESFLF
ncbi:hypothetical protein QCN29_17165 [Streptomyces sp. HNM0663]|uniref:Uncharacterized protein n=1 Tax=Streptomyces chengmaiensis TaxID=3040919 RepID=A0ABT6HP41_9ACTN|nr:hypothetical protein [Streptomyces chengmaiensis]MDH2390494.1 hypothetical protein [Streptomyces chengmaiensis]